MMLTPAKNLLEDSNRYEAQPTILSSKVSNIYVKQLYKLLQRKKETQTYRSYWTSIDLDLIPLI